MPLQVLGVSIDRPRCFALLEHATLGHLGLTLGALPAILPVDFAVVPRQPGALADADEVVVRLPAADGLERAVHGQVACLQAEDLDLEAGTGWSVAVTGPTRLVVDDEETRRLADLRVGSWARSGGTDRFVAVRADLVQGHWLRAR